MEEDEKLLTNYFYGKCTPEEKLRAQELLHAPEAEDFFRRLSWKEWNEPVQEDEIIRATHARWKKNVDARILSMEGDTLKRNSPVRWLKKFRYAAIWLGVLLVSSILVWQWQTGGQSKQATITNRQSIPVRYLLPDSSAVFLAAESTVSYPEHFTGKTREINLQGEAFFQVTPDPNKPFIIHTGDISTRVLGTSFKVTALEGRPLEVAVATGKVSVSRKEETLATLTPGHKVTWYAQEQKAVPGQVSIDGMEQWKNGDLVFDRMDMEYIADELQRRYGVTIVFADGEVKANRVSGTFAASKTVDQVMKTLAIAGKFRYESQDGKTIRIYKPN
jgi:transmembrane sensor